MSLLPKISIFIFVYLFHSRTFANIVGDPQGLFQGNDKINNAVAGFNWVLTAVTAVPALLFLVYAGKKFNDQEYGSALGSLIGSILCGIGSYFVGLYTS